MLISSSTCFAAKMEKEFAKYAKSACEKESGYFSTCFDIEEKTCIEKTTQAFKSCWNLSKRETASNSSSSEQELLTKLDKCVVRDLSIQWKNKSKKHPTCFALSKEK